MKILFHANAPWCCSGYGIQGRHLTAGWQRLGHEVAYSSYYGLQGGRLNMNGVSILSAGIDPWGNDIIEGHCKATAADLVVSLLDIWVLDPDVWGNLPARWAPWFPVDQLPCPPKVAELAQRAHYPLVYSRFGQREMERLGVETWYIPHGVDTTVFKPGDGRGMRTQLECDEETFLVGMVAANKDLPSRKNFWGQMEAFARFHEGHSNSRLYIHTLPMAVQGGAPVEQYAVELGIDDAVTFPSQYHYVTGFPDGHMAELYNAFDVLLSATHGEGFCIPLLEAQACGTPVIATDWTAMSELVWSGHKVPVAAELKTALGGCWGLPSRDGIIGALEDVASWDGERREAESEHAVAMSQGYDWQLLIDTMWQPLLEEVAEDIGGANTTHRHRWSEIGTWVDGELWVPCCEKGCPASKRRDQDGLWTIHSTGFEMEAGGIALDIEDDLRSAAAKTVMRELRDGYIPDDIEIRPGDVILDIGAHVGVVTCWMGKRWPDAHIIAVEPVPENFERLQSNLAANDVTNTVQVEAAITSDEREVVLRGKPSQNTGGYTEFANGAVVLSVPSYDLEFIFETARANFGADRIRLLKIDVEGAEYDILYHADGLLDRVDYIVGELHMSPELQRRGYSPQALADWCNERVAERCEFGAFSQIG